MRRYADPVEVRQGILDETTDSAGEGAEAPEAPQQFLWRGRVWKVRAVLAHWVETGPWWHSGGARAVVGTEEAPVDTSTPGRTAPRIPLGDLISERELWRVEAGRGLPALRADPADPLADPADRLVSGVFDLSFDWSEGRWTLVGCTD